jgi:hypothetical protein
MIKAVSNLMASGTGSLMEHRRPNLIQGLARGSSNKRLRRTFRQERIQQLGSEESRLRAETNQDFSMIPAVDRDITNLQDRINTLRTGNRESVPAQILINMIQQQSQQQNLITGLQQEQARQEEQNVAGLSGLMTEISRTQSAPPSRSSSRARDSVSPSPRRRRRERSPSQPRARSPDTSPERFEEPEQPEPPEPIGGEPPPSGLAQARRGRGANLPISRYNVSKLSVERKRAMGLPPNATHEQARARAIELGIPFIVIGSEGAKPRNRPDRDIFREMIDKTALRREQRIEEIRNLPPPIEPIQEESGNETVTVGRMGGAETETDAE